MLRVRRLSGPSGGGRFIAGTLKWVPASFLGDNESFEGGEAVLPSLGTTSIL